MEKIDDLKERIEKCRFIALYQCDKNPFITNVRYLKTREKKKLFEVMEVVWADTDANITSKFNELVCETFQEEDYTQIVPKL
jgi:hypothetical protein